MRKGQYISSQLAAVHSPKCGCAECYQVSGLFDDLVQKASDTADLLFGETADTSSDDGVSPTHKTTVSTSTSTSTPKASSGSGSTVRRPPASVPAAVAAGSTIPVGLIAGMAVVAGALYFITKKK